MRLIESILLVILLSSSVVSAGDPPKAKPTNWNKIYDSLLLRAKNLDSSVDFIELRITYAKTTYYNPYRDPGHFKDSMYAARQRNDIKAVLKFATAVLDSNYLDIDGHTLSGYACNILGDSAGYKVHNWFFKRLVQSIVDSGTGKSPERAFYLISIDEEHTMLTLMQINVITKSMVVEEGFQLSKVEATDPERGGKQLTIYFNLDLPTNWLKENSKMPKAG